MTADRTPAILACMRDLAEDAARRAGDQQATVDALTAHAALCIATDDVAALALAPFGGHDEALARGLIEVLAGERPPVTAAVDVVAARRVATRLACVALACTPYDGSHGPEAAWMWEAARRLGGFSLPPVRLTARLGAHGVTTITSDDPGVTIVLTSVTNEPADDGKANGGPYRRAGGH
jgi:hypothetical protein